jgi:hypothetical protein
MTTEAQRLFNFEEVSELRGMAKEFSKISMLQ